MTNFNKQNDSKSQQQQQSSSTSGNNQKSQQEKHQDQQKNAENKPNINAPKEHNENPVKKYFFSRLDQSHLKGSPF